ncbi:alpha/beta hydrolase [Sandaracinus amylolyticus]|uniref:alpha/beta hydrolase n=1 Tax=Sandaracinus amylolyticus TaxID=927083 RepID=UPI001F47B142|nr:alpha/beta fold hydrolase [Sandaracinus amylolyticus]UJR80064.1 Hypothetical protein I5071_21080 [Sandaracinus amylolyticus]
MRRNVVRGATALAVLAVLWAGSGIGAATALTHRWRARFDEPTPEGARTLRLRASDGVAIGAWEIEGGDGAAIVVTHGNGSARSAMIEEGRALASHGHDVLAISVRAHGDSEGETNDVGWSARRDVIAAVEHLEREAPSRPIVLLGASLGAAASVFAAAELGGRVDGLVLVAPYADLRDAVARRTERYLPPVLDGLAYGALLLGARVVMPELDRIRPEASARGIDRDVPVLVFAGSADRRAPIDDARRITRTLSRARIVAIEGADHEEMMTRSFEHIADIDALLRDALARRATR